MIKKIIAALSAAVLIIPSIPLNAAAEEISCDSSVLTYTVNGSSAVITGYKSAGAIVTIPEVIGGLNVTEISSGAFSDCENAVTLTVPNSLVKIGEKAFENCRNLKTIYIGNSVSEIGSYAFSGCQSLESFTVGGLNSSFSVKNGMLCNSGGTELIAYAGAADASVPEGITSIGKAAFFSNSRIRSVSLPAGLVSIGDYAFSGCLNLKEISLPSTVKSLGTGSFMSCSSLEKAILSGGLSSVPNECFSMCTSLAAVNFPSGITSLGDSAFYSCGKLTGSEIPPTVKTIGSNAIGTHYDMISRKNAAFNGFYLSGTYGSAAEAYCKSNKIGFLDYNNLRYGDINGDGTVDATDASGILAEYAAVATGRTPSFTYVQTLLGDYNCDGTINAVDASCVLSYYASVATGALPR